MSTHVLLSALLLAGPEVEVRPPVDRPAVTLSGGQAHAYPVVLRPGQALFGVVTQRGVDVVVSLRDPKDAVVAEVDSPNGIAGPEPLAFVAAIAGRYVLEVRALEANAAAGSYDLRLEPLRAATARDRDIVTAQSLHASALTTRGQALHQQGQARFVESSRLYAEAARDAREALGLRQRAFGPDHSDVAASHQVLGLIDDEVGDYVTGKEHFVHALRILEAQAGPDHPSTLTTRSDLGYLALANGDWREAEQLFTSVLQRREQALGPDHVSLANSIVGLGEALLRLGELERAEAVLRRGLAVREKVVGPGHESLSWLWLNVGRVLAARGRAAEAQEMCGRARALAEARPQSSRLHLASAHACLGKARPGDPSAVDHFREALRIREAAGGPDHPWTAEALGDLGSALAAAGRREEAEPLLRRALHIRERRLRDGHPALAESREALAALARAGSVGAFTTAPS